MNSPEQASFKELIENFDDIRDGLDRISEMAKEHDDDAREYQRQLIECMKRRAEGIEQKIKCYESQREMVALLREAQVQPYLPREGDLFHDTDGNVFEITTVVSGTVRTKHNEHVEWINELEAVPFDGGFSLDMPVRWQLSDPYGLKETLYNWKQ